MKHKTNKSDKNLEQSKTPTQLPFIKLSFADMANDPPPETTVFVIFTLENVEQNDIGDFTKAFDVHRMSPDALKRLMGKCQFFISGYDDDPRDLSQIPEARKYLQTLHSHWPYWFFFAPSNPEASLHLLWACLEPRSEICEGKIQWILNKDDVVDFYNYSLKAMLFPWLKAGFSEQSYKIRCEDIFANLKRHYASIK